MKSSTDPIQNLAELIACPSVTPQEGGALTAVQSMLEPLGFSVDRPVFSDDGTPDVENLYARRSGNGPHLMFAGHTDVVPVGDEAAWTYPPFSAAIHNGEMYGRGAVDMKGGIACFAAAVARTLKKNSELKGSISFLITGDEEGPSINGTGKLLEWARAKGESWDAAIVGEPTNPDRLGDMIKIGRRGSINTWIIVDGRQGHVAYPHRAANPIPVLIDLLAKLQNHVLDDGYTGFQPSNLEVTTVDVANGATNVIPAQAKARLNIRFNPAHKGAELAAWIEAEAAKAAEGFAGTIKVEPVVSGEAFLTEPGAFTDLVAAAVQDVAGAAPELSTTGGTSDARFIRDLCPVVELGLVGKTMHAIDERAPVEEIRNLQRVYERVIERYYTAFT